jgi:hypothetical protein
MSNKSTFDFVPVHGYKDIFYSPCTTTTLNTKRKLIPIPINTFTNEKIHLDLKKGNIMNRRKINSKIHRFNFPISPVILHDSNTTETIYDIIKHKLTDIINGDSAEKKRFLADNITKLLQEVNTDIETLALFLETI